MEIKMLTLTFMDYVIEHFPTLSKQKAQENLC